MRNKSKITSVEKEGVRGKVTYREQLLEEKRRRYDENDVCLIFGEIKQQLRQ